VDEVDQAAGGATARRVVQQPQAALAQRSARALDVLDRVGELLDTRAIAIEELRDRRLGGQRREQLDAGGAVADGQHRLADALLDVRLLVHARDAERVGVERDRGVEIGDGDADVIDLGEQAGGHGIGRHRSIVATETACGRGLRAVVHIPRRGARPAGAWLQWR
jgi:hypothetical protein